MELKPCNQRIYNEGECVLIVASLPSETIDKLVRDASILAGETIDWFWMGGRAVIKTMPDATQKARDALSFLRVCFDVAYREQFPHLRGVNDGGKLARCPWRWHHPQHPGLSERDELILKMRNEKRASFFEEETRAMARWRLNWSIYEKLRILGLMSKRLPDVAWTIRFGPEIKVEPEDLPRLRTVFPQVTDSGKYSVEDADRNLVRVFLDLGLGVFETSEYVYYIRPYYLKVLPPDARCRIERSTSMSAEVVCGVN